MALRVQPADRVDHFTCPDCHAEYARVYGDVFDDDTRLGVYSADLHSRAHDSQVLLAIGTQCWNEETQAWEKCSVTLEVWPTEAEYQMAFRDSSASSYKNNLLLGRVLNRDEARARPERDTFFHMADHIITEDSRVRAHLDGSDGFVQESLF